MMAGGILMDGQVSFDDKYARDSLEAARIDEMLCNSAQQLQMLIKRTGPGAGLTGWLDLPVDTPRSQLEKIESTAAMLRENSDMVVICGIGGSYLGARAGLEFLDNPSRSAGKSVQPDIVFAGNSLSPSQMRQLLAQIAGRRISVVVVSKSGTTLETAIAFHILQTELTRQFGKTEALSRMVAITDPDHGVLRDMTNAEGFTALDLPVDVGGRYSVLTAVGLLPFAIRGFDIRTILQGAAEQRAASLSAPAALNGALQYATLRRLLNDDGKNVELFAGFEPAIHSVGEWWKQLFGESEGKNGKGIFPTSADYTTDLHSLGQFVQQGTRCLFETIVDVAASADVTFTCAPDSLDGLGYLNGTTLARMNRDARTGTMLAHHDGGVPVLQLSVPDFSERSFGAMVYFFEIACAVSGYLLGINPFDQPGVEAYKHHMFALLGKPDANGTAGHTG